MGAKTHKKPTESPKVEVGEIDTRAPFQSVKDAVTLFGEGAFSGERPAIKKAKPHSAERVLAKETQLHLARKELSKLKDQLQNAESTKVQAHVELEKANRTVEDLTQKLQTVNKSKDVAIKSTETAKDQANHIEVTNSGNLVGADGGWKQDFESARANYMNAITELDAAKQELRQIQLDSNTFLVAKDAAFLEAMAAENAVKANTKRASELSKEITAVQESIRQVKLETSQAQHGQAEIYVDKDAQKQSHKVYLEESVKKLLALKKECDPELINARKVQLADTLAQIGALQKETEFAKISELVCLKNITSELDDAKESLHKVVEEESSLRSLLQSLKLELENVKKEHSELKEKAVENESLAGNLHIQLRKSKSEYAVALVEESKVKGDTEEIILMLQQLSTECVDERLEAEEMKKKSEELKKEAEATRIALKVAENNLRAAFDEAEEAKTDEARALGQIKTLSERTNAARASASESGARITISKEEFESLSKKVEVSDKLAEMKVAAAAAQVQAVKASEKDAISRLEATREEVESTKIATEEALKRAEMAEAAKKAVDGELRRWRDREHKKAAEAASMIILAQTEVSSESSSFDHGTRKQKNLVEKKSRVAKLEKVKTSLSKRALLPNLSGIFHRKKNQIEGGSPSYLPGEKPL